MLPALPFPSSTGGSAQGGNLSTLQRSAEGAHLRAPAWFLLHLCTFRAAASCPQFVAQRLPPRQRSCRSQGLAGSGGTGATYRCLMLSSPAAHPSVAGPRGAAGTGMPRCLARPGLLSGVATSLCCHRVFESSSCCRKRWRVSGVPCSQRREARGGGVFRQGWIYELKSSHLASSVSGCRKANVTMEVGRIKTRNPS